MLMIFHCSLQLVSDQVKNYTRSQDLEKFLEFHHQGPVTFLKVVSEPVLARVYRLSRDLTDHHVLVVKVTTKHLGSITSWALYLLLHDVRLVFSEPVKKVVDNVCLEDFNSFSVSHLLCVSLHLNIESKDAGIFLLMLQHGAGSHHVFPNDWADTHPGIWDLAGLQELKQGLQASKS